MKYHVQGEVTIFVDYDEEEGADEADARRLAIQWLKEEYRLYGGPDEHNISITVELIEAEVGA